MRDIKFRAWDKKKEIMVQHDNPYVNQFLVTKIVNNFLTDGSAIPIEDDFVFMQYVGFKDKNGSEIYEGDLVEKREYNGTEENKNIYEVIFDHGGFCLKRDDTLYSFGADKNCTLRKELIIGNVHCKI